MGSSGIKQQKPTPPTDVSVDVNFGSASTLKVSYGAPNSDGGAVIEKYRIELDNVADFSTAIYNEIPCSTSNEHTVYMIKTSGLANDPIVSGYFNLQLAVNQRTYTTDFIPYDATAMKGDEVGFTTLLSSFVVEARDGSDILVPSIDVSELLFEGDRIQLSSQLNPDEIYTVTDVAANVTLDTGVSLPDGETMLTVSVLRYSGGRGPVAFSRVACRSGALCSESRRKISGSMESKFEFLSDAIIAGVEVDRDGPDETNGYTWRVTFLDNSPPNPYDFTVSVASKNLLTESGAAGLLTITHLVDGESYPSCTGTHVVPSNKALTMGEYYYARVFAYNSIGFSLAQVAPSAQKPMVVPGRPTSVVLKTVSKCELRVSFNPPDSDGGDTITEYLIEYATKSDFSNAQSTSLTYLSGGAPFFKTIQEVEQGVFYFVRVKAKNSQGYGEPAMSTPGSLQPYEESSAPTNVRLEVTSNSLLTVSWGPPENDGGDTIRSYRIEWDIAPGFNGIAAKPHKGTKDVDANEFSSYTIEHLTEGRKYYVRVFAVNSAGPSTPALTTPNFAQPGLQVPGKPHTISAVTGSLVGSITVTWQRPRVPWHGIPCSGLVTEPDDCPAPVGSVLPASTGGTPIKEYLIAYNEREDFKGFDAGEVTTTASTYTLEDLTPGRVYYIRILARNAMGSGQFCSHTDANCLITTTRVKATARAA